MYVRVFVIGAASLHREGIRRVPRAAQPHPAGPDAGKQWVEVATAGPAAGALSGYRIEDKPGGAQPLEGLVTPSSPRRVYIPKTGGIKLAIPGDRIALFRGDTELHRVACRSAGAAAVLAFPPPDPGDGPPSPPGRCPESADGAALPDADPC